MTDVAICMKYDRLIPIEFSLIPEPCFYLHSYNAYIYIIYVYIYFYIHNYVICALYVLFCDRHCRSFLIPTNSKINKTSTSPFVCLNKASISPFAHLFTCICITYMFPFANPNIFRNHKLSRGI